MKKIMMLCLVLTTTQVFAQKISFSTLSDTALILKTLFGQTQYNAQEKALKWTPDAQLRLQLGEKLHTTLESILFFKEKTEFALIITRSAVVDEKGEVFYGKIQNSMYSIAKVSYENNQWELQGFTRDFLITDGVANYFNIKKVNAKDYILEHHQYTYTASVDVSYTTLYSIVSLKSLLFLESWSNEGRLFNDEYSYKTTYDINTDTGIITTYKKGTFLENDTIKAVDETKYYQYDTQKQELNLIKK
jgi:hypothetical protein